MKFFKKIALSCLAFMLCLGMASVAACGSKKKNNDTSSSSAATSSSTVNSEAGSAENSSVASTESAGNNTTSGTVNNSAATSNSTEVSNATSSGNNEESSGIVTQANAYNFKILKADGTPAVGYKIQMCTTNGSGVCYAFSSASDTNGFVAVTQNPRICPNPAIYEVHVVDSTNTQVALAATVHTPAAFSAELIVVTLAN